MRKQQQQPEVKSNDGETLKRKVPTALRKLLPAVDPSLVRNVSRCLAFILTAQYAALLSVLYMGLPVRHPLFLILMPFMIGGAASIGWQERGIEVTVGIGPKPMAEKSAEKSKRLDVN